MLYHSQWILSFRASKQKLESLLQQWSEWEAEQSYLPCQSDQDQEPALETGEDTYFPALRVGLQKTSSVVSENVTIRI